MERKKPYRVTVMQGDGIGPEIVESMIQVLTLTGVPFEWDYHPIGEKARILFGTGLPEETLASIRRNKLAIKGPTATRGKSINLMLREDGHFAGYRQFNSMPGLKTRWSDVLVDILLFREGIEDLYAGRETKMEDRAEAVSVISVVNTLNIARFAFAEARRRNRKKMTIIHKSNILPVTHGLFLEIAQRVGKDYPEITLDYAKYADATAADIVGNPEWFDCILAPNFLGDILSDVLAKIIGGIGYAPGGNMGHDRALFEAVGGTAPDIVGKGIANPTGMILSGAMMLDYLGETVAAAHVRNGVNWAISKSGLVTPDGRVASTEKFTEAVYMHLASLV